MATTVAKEAMAIKYSNKTSHSITKYLDSPFAGKHPKPIQKGTKAAAAEAVVTAAEAIAVAELEETGAPYVSAGSHTSGAVCRRPARSIARIS